MNYKDRAKNRRLKKDMVNMINIFKFRTWNIKLSWKVILSWISISLIWLFSPWILHIESGNTENSFSASTWNIWMTNFIIILLLIFLILSINNKEKIKKYSWVQIKDYIVVISLWLFITVLSLHSIIFIKSLLSFSKDISLWKWSIISLTWSILIIIWWILMRKDYNKENISYLNDAEDRYKNNVKWKKNSEMKLPF